MYSLLLTGLLVTFGQARINSHLLFPPGDCLPMSDSTYDANRHKGMKKEIVETFSPTYSRILYCHEGCCGDGTNMGLQCCLASEDSGTDTLKMVSIIAGGTIGLLLVVISLIHYVKANNKKKRVIADIQSLQKTGKGKKKKNKAKKIKVGEYHRDQMDRGGGGGGGGGAETKTSWNQVPQGNIFMTKSALPAISSTSKSQPGPSEFSAIMPTAETGDPFYQNTALKPGPVPPPYNPDQEVLKSIIANLPGPKVMPASDNVNNHTAFYGRY